ncbi:MAG: DUF1232 domain-containing protein [Candidatus Marinimicrobia bacterium]|nr:DUF1232 domain-containing protein [Candidatus Neomarinimicrobiota bacterium]
MKKTVSFKLTDEDIQRYEKQIAAIDLNIEDELLQKIAVKIKSIVTSGNISSIQLSLIEDVSKLVIILRKVDNLELSVKRKILFALQYFYDPEDDIPDRVTQLGFLDDAILVKWIIDPILTKYPEYFQI